MGLFNVFIKKKYDMDSLNGINSIPVPAKNYNSGNEKNDCIYYLLQRKATEHKKNKRMDLAIACLRKSNELSDYEARPLLSQKEYIRLVKFIESTGDKELANTELSKIRAKHPEFFDKRISNLSRIKETLAKCEEYKNDYVYVATNSNCPICSPYNKKIYSISGNSDKFEQLPRAIKELGGSCADCAISVSCYFEGI